MRQIKIILISLYVIILGFIVFGNTSVFADTEGATQVSVFQTADDFSDYFVNMQDNFDFSMLNYKDRNGFSYFYNAFINPSTAWAPRPAWNYFVESSPDVPGSSGGATARRGWVITIYAASQNNNLLVSNTDFQFINFTDYNSVGTFKVPTVPVYGWWKIGIYDDGRAYTFITNGASFTYNCPLNILNYSHPLVNNYLLNTNTNGASQVTNAIQQQTNTIVNETQKQTNQITGTISNATQQQTNQLLDTNDTGNETMSVNDTTTDTSADLGGLFNSINSAFTDTTSETQKRF